MSAAVATVILATAIASMMPLLLAAVGETVGEQSGVLNIGVEGLLLIGAFTGFLVTRATESFWFGVLGDTAAGALSALVMVGLSVWLGVNQIIVGIGITLAGTGVTSMLYDWLFSAERPRLGAAPHWQVLPLSEVPVAGPVLFAQPGAFYAALCITLLTGLWLSRTAPGLRLRAAGQRPASLDAAGGDVLRTRTSAVIFGGAMAGLGGAYLALFVAGTFTPGMTHGLGFLAIVAAMLGRGRVWLVALIALVYGAFVSAGTAFQLMSVRIPNDLITIAPFIAVMLALILLRGKSVLPPALATSYSRGDR